ncbi:hypothetical protein HDU96_007224 [Phlyctochytrium bullatum]|nr:hypothetical protein HDU96_007224 [Phlyctochytrium bullatum]
MVKVKVLYFASAKDAAGTAEEILDIPATASRKNVASLRELAAELERRHPQIAPVLKTCMLAVNLDYVENGLWKEVDGKTLDVDALPPQAFVTDGDEVGVIPPVSGG